MDDRWESEIIEFGAINITGFRLVDTNRRLVKDFYDSWKRLDPTTSIGAGRESISVSVGKKRRCVLYKTKNIHFRKNGCLIILEKSLYEGFNLLISKMR